MSDPSFRRAVKVIEDAKRLPSSAATKLMFDHFRVASQPERDAFVLALIGDVLTGVSRTVCTAAGEVR